MSNLRDRICRQCSRSFLGGPRAYYCPYCRIERRQEQNRNFKIRKSKGDYRPHGSIDKCERCGGEYTVEASLQRFCPDCQKPHEMEHGRVKSLEFYTENKTSINPNRNSRRRIGQKTCAWCGKEFQSSTKAVTCSNECKRLQINKMYRERYKLKNKKEGGEKNER